MSLKIIMRKTESFVCSSNPEVIAIKGHWGSGKTYFWDKIFRDMLGQNRVKMASYSYVSLFGVNSLDDLKREIFANMVSLRKGQPSFEKSKVMRRVKGLYQSIRAFSAYIDPLDVPIIEAGAAIQTFGFPSLSAAMICIDDVERMGKDLDLRDVMGLISLLRDQRKCKVAVIFNETKFDTKSFEDYEEYREKVIDVELRYSPSPLECAEIAFADNSRRKQLTALTTSLGIDNIRILFKISAFAKMMTYHFDREKFEPEVSEKALHSLCLLCWSFYGQHGETPDLAFIKNFNSIRLVLKDLTEEQYKWNRVLQGYNYKSFSDFDQQVLYFVERGYIEKAAFLNEARHVNEQVLQSKLANSFTAAWDLLSNSFDDNRDEFINTLLTSFAGSVGAITPITLDATVKIVRELGYDYEADQLIAYYVQNRDQEAEIFDLMNSIAGHKITDPKLIATFDEQMQRQLQSQTFPSVLLNASQTNGWSERDEIILSDASEEEYYAFFKSEKGDVLRKAVLYCLNYGGHESYNTVRKTIVTDKATRALLRIAGESDLNRIRVSNFIQIPMHTPVQRKSRKV